MSKFFKYFFLGLSFINFFAAYLACGKKDNILGLLGLGAESFDIEWVLKLISLGLIFLTLSILYHMYHLDKNK